MTASPTSDPDAAEVADRFRRSLMRLTRILRHHDRDDLSPTLSSALFSIDREGPCTLGDLSRLERMTKPSVTAVVEKLAGLGLIDRYQDEHDRRIFRVRVTSMGRRRVAKRRTQRTAWLADRMDLLSLEDLRRIEAATEILERIIRFEDAEPSS